VDIDLLLSVSSILPCCTGAEGPVAEVGVGVLERAVLVVVLDVEADFVAWAYEGLVGSCAGTAGRGVVSSEVECEGALADEVTMEGV